MAAPTSRSSRGVLAVIGVGTLVLVLWWVFAQPEVPASNAGGRSAVIDAAIDRLSVALDRTAADLKATDSGLATPGASRLEWDDGIAHVDSASGTILFVTRSQDVADKGGAALPLTQLAFASENTLTELGWTSKMLEGGRFAKISEGVRKRGEYWVYEQEWAGQSQAGIDSGERILVTLSAITGRLLDLQTHLGAVVPSVEEKPNISEAQAIAIARDAMSKRVAEISPYGVDVQELDVASVTLKYNTGRMIANGQTRLVWMVRLVGEGESAVYGGPVMVDAKTGDILFLGSY